MVKKKYYEEIDKECALNVLCFYFYFFPVVIVGNWLDNLFEHVETLHGRSFGEKYQTFF